MKPEQEHDRPIPSRVGARMRQICLVVMDVDGVLTDGRIIYSDRGEELKAFHVRDGLGIVLLGRAGVRTAILTGRSSQAVARRGRELGVDRICQGVRKKLPCFVDLVSEFDCSPAEAAFIGDDLNDLAVMQRAGLAAAVPQAAPEVRAAADYVTQAPGGAGAVRELAECILKSRGSWQEIIGNYG